MKHVSRTHRVALDWLFVRINLDPKIQIKYIDTKNQLSDMLTKGNFTHDERNHLLRLFNISHFSSTVCSGAMSKRTQEDSGEERVTAKSKPMTNLVWRCSERTLDALKIMVAGLLWERQFEKVLLENGWVKFPNWECLLLTERRNYSCLCTWTVSCWQERNKLWIQCGRYS